jgi:kynurenine formamidase
MPSLDIAPSADSPAHVSWLPSGRYGLENLANLEQILRRLRWWSWGSRRSGEAVVALPAFCLVA